MARSPKIAFVLSGGASLGAIQVGMLQALYERGIEPDLIVASSVGALNGAFIASRPQAPETADELAQVWRGIGRGQVFPLNPLTGFFGFFGLKDHLVPDGSLRRIIGDQVDFERLEAAPIPLQRDRYGRPQRGGLAQRHPVQGTSEASSMPAITLASMKVSRPA